MSEFQYLFLSSLSCIFLNIKFIITVPNIVISMKKIRVLVYGIGHIVLCIIDMVNANARAAATPYFTLDGWIAYNAFSNVLGIAIVMIIVIVIFQVIYKYMKNMKKKYYW